MRNFSELNIQSSKEILVNDFASKSGLDKDFCSKLYEDYNMQFAGDKQAIAEKFKSLLKTNLTKDSELIDNFLKELLSNNKEHSKQLLIDNFLQNYCNDIDESLYYRVILTILYLKDNLNFQKLATEFADIENYKIPETISPNKKLNEAFGIDPYGSKEGSVPKIIGVNDGCSIQDDINFYGDLKTMLGRNNKRFGHNYHLDNVYKAILGYLDKEIEYLTTKDNITTVTQDFEETLISQLIHGELNVMYRHIDVLRPLIVDIQTLVFDMMCLTMCYIKQNTMYLSYINRKEFDDVIAAFENLYSKISSSRTTSLLLRPYEHCNSGEHIHDEGYGKFKEEPNGCLKIWDDLFVDYRKYDVYLQPLKTVAAVDALYIIKECTSEFNLTIRPAMNLFVTKAMNVIGRIEHLMAESKKFNKFKNPIY